MEEYQGLEEQDLKIIQIALSKLPITGAEAQMMVKLQKKVQMELDFINTPKQQKPKKGDTLIKG
jgi:hypothetical protein